ncbi:DUF1627 domain-containing protein [Salmonella enterica]|nr:DUF1627 domain-containing protein [Salmonella enterica]
MPNETVTVLDVLKEAGKATAQEIAAKLDIDQVDTLVMLQEEMEQGTVACEGGRWSLVNVSNVNISASIDTDVNIDAPPPPVDPNIIFRALQQNGAMTAATLANFVNRTPRGMASVMSGMARRGLVVKNGQGEGCTWSLPSTNASASVNAGSGTSVGGTSEDVGAKVPASPVLIDATSNPQKASVQEMTTTAGYDAGAGESIPAFPDTDADDFVFRLLTRGNQERQRVRECAARLDEVCDALSVLHKYPDLIHQLSKGEKK